MLALNLLLAILALTAAILAIGGETWNKRAKGWAKVTPQGWLAIVCALLTFLIGIIKENQSAKNEHEAEVKAARLQATVEGQLTEIRNLNERIEDLRAYASAAAQDRDREASERAEEKRKQNRAKELVV